MKVGIVGLGLIGGSFAKAYHKAGHTVIAADTDDSILKFAIIDGIVSEKLTDKNVGTCDLVLICTYPEAAAEYMETNGKYIGGRPVVIDCCGIKKEVVSRGMAAAKKYGFTFAGGHPMAGTQYSGYKYSKENMFVRAPMVIVPPVYDDVAILNRIKELLTPAGFSRITVTTANEHDEIIAYTSQLAHVVSNAFVKSPTVKKHTGVSAGSYNDLTRVARLNPEMWAELFMANKDNLIFEIKNLIENLNSYKDALESSDTEKLIDLLEQGSRIKKEVDG
ncbi:MAG: prephenate dehydrogenase [Clostridia bacterium]|nr:prephenate dehydrogenase [Clostridia bacterium]